MNIHYIIGDATKPIKNPAIICHVNNDIGGWGRGFVLAVSNVFPEAENAYRSRFKSGYPMKLGETQIIEISDNNGQSTGIYVANMVAQHDVKNKNGLPPIRYGSLRCCLDQVYKSALEYGCTVHMPRIGSDLAGGDWKTVESIIKSAMTVDTYVYTLPNQKDRWDDEYEGVQ